MLKTMGLRKSMDLEQFASPMIYVVDDDVDMLSSLQTLLAREKVAAVRPFSSGDAFLREMADLPRGCVLLDLNMPGASGLDVLRASMSRRHDLAFVILSGEGLISSAVEALKLGAIDYLEKPCPPDRLRDVVGRVLEYLAADAGRNRAQEEARALLASLSPREHDVLQGLIEGKPHKIIAHDLQLSFRTIEIYRHKLMRKLGVRSLSDALGIAFRAGLRRDAGLEPELVQQ
jgi:two-component system response regulator FixJ